MRSLKFYTTIILMFVGFIGFAQSKVAHIDTQLLISEMPEALEAQAQIEKLQKTYQVEYDASLKELQTKMQNYEAEAENKTDVINQARQKELQGMELNLRQYQQTAAQDIQQKSQDLMRPIIEKARDAIQKVARDQGFEYVLEAGTLLLSDGKDLMADVKKELGF